MNRLLPWYGLVVSTVAVALGLGYALGIALVPTPEACVIAFAFGMGWNATLPATLRTVWRAVR